MKPSVLTIAGSDPSGGAGIQADLRVFSALNVIGLSAITALTVQNSQGVLSIHPVPADILSAQIECVLAESSVNAVKIGMLGGADQVRAVAAILRRVRPPFVVLDPVIASSGGVPLLDTDGIRALVEELLPVCHVVTPNLPEARQLAGIRSDQVVSDLSIAQRIFELGVEAVIITGGHALPQSGNSVTDTLYIRSKEVVEAVEAVGQRVQTQHNHGTGCLHSSAIAACLARGMSLRSAAFYAKALVSDALASPIVAGLGRGFPDVMAAVCAGQFGDSRTHAQRLSLLAGIYVLNDGVLRPDRPAEEIVRCALDGGARIIQLREKRLPTPELISLAQRLNGIVRAAGGLFIVNDRVDVALASDADGVHLGPDDMLPPDARRLLAPDRLIGVSVNSVDEAAAAAEFASYLGVGAIYGSATKSDAGAAIGIEPIRKIKTAFPDHPLVAIGGIHSGNISDIQEAGATAAAVVSAVVCAPDMRCATEDLVRTFAASLQGVERTY